MSHRDYSKIAGQCETGVSWTRAPETHRWTRWTRWTTLPSLITWPLRGVSYIIFRALSPPNDEIGPDSPIVRRSVLGDVQYCGHIPHVAKNSGQHGSKCGSTKIGDSSPSRGSNSVSSSPRWGSNSDSDETGSSPRDVEEPCSSTVGIFGWREAESHSLSWREGFSGRARKNRLRS